MHNGWKSGDFNLLMFNVSFSEGEGMWVVAIGLLGFGIGMMVEMPRNSF